MVCFQSFVLTVFWCSTSYTVIIVFWMMLMEPVDAPVCWWPCACLKCVSGLRRLEKNLEFFEVHTCHWPGAQIWFGQKWRKLVTASPSLLCIDWYRCLLHWSVFFLSCVPGFRLKFSRIALWWKRLQVVSENDLALNGLILGFFVRKRLPPSTSYLYGMKSARINQLLIVFDDIKFFWCFVWGVFWSVVINLLISFILWCLQRRWPKRKLVYQMKCSLMKMAIITW